MSNSLVLFIKFVIGTIILMSISSCESELSQIDNPEKYTFFRAGESTVSFSGQTTRMKMAIELKHAMLDVSKSKDELLNMFTNQGMEIDPFTDPELNESTKNIRSKLAASKDFFETNSVESASIRREFDNWLTFQAEEIFPSIGQEAARGKAGFILHGSNTIYVNAKGLEYDQVFTNALIGGLMVDQMLNNYLSPEVLDAGSNVLNNDTKVLAEGKAYTDMEHKWDEAYGYLFGLSSNPQNPLLVLSEDCFLSECLDRVDGDNDFDGIALEIFEAFKLGRAAIVAGKYEIRDQQADIIKEAISKVIAVQAVHFLQMSKQEIIESGLSGTVFHHLSQSYGFLHSLRFTRKAGSSDSYFSRSEIDSFLHLLEDQQGFWDVSAETLDTLSEAISEKFNFTVEQANE